MSKTSTHLGPKRWFSRRETARHQDHTSDRYGVTRDRIGLLSQVSIQSSLNPLRTLTFARLGSPAWTGPVFGITPWPPVQISSRIAHPKLRSFRLQIRTWEIHLVETWQRTRAIHYQIYTLQSFHVIAYHAWHVRHDTCISMRHIRSDMQNKAISMAQTNEAGGAYDFIGILETLIDGYQPTYQIYLKRALDTIIKKKRIFNVFQQ